MVCAQSQDWLERPRLGARGCGLGHQVHQAGHLLLPGLSLPFCGPRGEGGGEKEKVWGGAFAWPLVAEPNRPVWLHLPLLGGQC